MATPPSTSSSGKRLSFPSSKVSPPPHEEHPDFDPVLAGIASRILFRSGIDPISSGPLYVISAAALPDPKTTDYDRLLPYVLSCLPSDDELADSSLGGGTYSLVLFAGGRADGKTNRPPWGWILQAYYLLGRAVRKKIQRLWIVHERAWIRIILEMLQTVVSPKFRRKIIHVTDLSELSHHINICKLEIPLQVYLHDRKLCPYIQIPHPPPPLFGEPPFPHIAGQRKDEIPIVLTDCSRYLRAYGLRTEGLFRVAASKQILDIAQEAYDRRQRIRMNEFGPHVAAGLVKLYYRSLPSPIIPERIYEDLEVRFDKNNTASKEETLRILLYNTETNGGLPEDSRKLLTRHLLPLLSLVAAHEPDNKMTASNLAICISASLTRSEDIMRDTEISRGPVKLLIQWGIEEFDRLSPALPQRKSSTGIDSEKGGATVF
ncbi:Rho GTPase activation protein [Ascobolus immersus RN42]|uniref:Rho GTPase activation protein n=1 Tax=Ascobolus immersus RN42 TaxID=1160509 RepID=A0A3N4I2V2_ASCIM|nr:Rho GTPase activation protein [Ascobolus immersus RN42]